MARVRHPTEVPRLRSGQAVGRRLGGVVVPAVTPFEDDGCTVSEPGVHQLVEFLVEQGVHGIFVAGTTGEAAALDDLQWRRLVQAASKALRGRVPLLAGVVAPTVWRHRVNAVRGGLVGLISGVLPGAGADIGAWLAYGVARRFSREPRKFGRGSMEAIVEAGVANNSDLAAEWIPTLVFGIPGDAFTAVVLGILMMKGMRPGPAILHNYADVLVAVYITFILANLLMVPLGFLAIRASSQMVRLPRNVLVPAILMMCVVGAYAINNSLFDVGLMLGMGVLGFILEAMEFPVAPIVLGLVLGPLLEQNFMISLIKSEGHLTLFFSRPVSVVLGTLTVAVWLLPLASLAWRLLRRRKGAPEPVAEG